MKDNKKDIKNAVKTLTKPYSKIDRPHSTSVQSATLDAPLIEDRSYLLEDNPNNKVSLIGDYFVLDIGLGIGQNDFLSDTIPGAEQFFIVPEGWVKRVFKSLGDMKAIPLQAKTVYFLDIPDFAQTLIVSSLNQGETLTIEKCRGYNSAISLADWGYIVGSIDELNAAIASNTEAIANNTEAIANNTEAISGNTGAITENTDSLLKKQDMFREYQYFLSQSAGENFLDNEPPSSIVEILGTSEPLLFLYNFTKTDKIGGNLLANFFVKGLGTITAQLQFNGVNILEPQSFTFPEAVVEFIDIQFLFKELILEVVDKNTFAISLSMDGITLKTGDKNNSSILQIQGGGGGGAGVKAFELDSATNILKITDTSNKEFTSDLTPIVDKAEQYTDDKIANLGDIFKFMGIVASEDKLPLTGNKVGDVWGVGDPTIIDSIMKFYIWVDSLEFELIGTTTIIPDVIISDTMIGSSVDLNLKEQPALIGGFALRNGQTLKAGQYNDDFMAWALANLPEGSVIGTDITLDVKHVASGYKKVTVEGIGTSTQYDNGVLYFETPVDGFVDFTPVVFPVPFLEIPICVSQTRITEVSETGIFGNTSFADSLTRLGYIASVDRGHRISTQAYGYWKEFTGTNKYIKVTSENAGDSYVITSAIDDKTYTKINTGVFFEKKIYFSLVENAKWSNGSIDPLIWEPIAGGGAVTSVNSKTGDVEIDKNDVGLGQVNNTSDLAKPISTATQQALYTQIQTRTPKGAFYHNDGNSYFDPRNYEKTDLEGYYINYSGIQIGEQVFDFENSELYCVQTGSNTRTGFIVASIELMVRNYGTSVYHKTNGNFDYNDFYVDFEYQDTVLRTGNYNVMNNLSNLQVYNYTGQIIAKGSDINEPKFNVIANSNAFSNGGIIRHADKYWRRGDLVSDDTENVSFVENPLSETFVLTIENGFPGFSRSKKWVAIIKDINTIASTPATKISLDSLRNAPVDIATEKYDVILDTNILALKYILKKKNSGTTSRCVAIRDTDLIISAEAEIVFNQAISVSTSGILINSDGEVECVDSGYYSANARFYVDETQDPKWNVWIEKYDAQAISPDWIIVDGSLNSVKKIKEDGARTINFAGGIDLYAGDKIRIKANASSGSVNLKNTTETVGLGSVTQYGLVLTFLRVGENTVKI